MKNFVKRSFSSAVKLYKFSTNLPFAYDQLEPVISQKTVEFHFDKHHQGYITKLNGTEGIEENTTLEDLIKCNDTPTGVYNLAAQIYNHDLFWNNLTTPKENNTPSTETKIGQLIESNFGTFKDFQNEFSTNAVTHFGSGWIFLVCDPKIQKLRIVNGHDAKNPLEEGFVPLLTIDVWEHSYYLDYQNDRAKYVEEWWKIVDWGAVNESITLGRKCEKNMEE